MSVHLWRFYLENDVERFRHFLAEANYTTHSQKITGGTGAQNAPFKIGSPSVLGTSPRIPLKTRKSTDSKSLPNQTKGAQSGQVLTRADINSKDASGCTILHHAVSSSEENALEFVQALLEIPLIDLYTQDAESGWTALHRALYFGNISAAQAILARDLQDATDYTSGMVHNHIGGLIKIKDHEGNSPFEVFGLTVASRDLHRHVQAIGSGDDDDLSSTGDPYDEDDPDATPMKSVKARTNLHGDEIFTFGSNKNLTLGLGDEDDRQFPERPSIQRPVHLLRRFHQELLDRQPKSYEAQDIGSSQFLPSSKDDLPAIIKERPLIIQDVVMSKLHTAVLTTDPASNLYMSGFGPGGRLGTGDETTRFKFICIEGGGLAGRRIINIALGQDHTIAISEQGEVFTWGSNKFGQLGYSLPISGTGQDAPTQLIPRQLFGSMKKETIIGAAASAVHSAIYSANALYTFGKNDGQLGLVDADARSLEFQVSPRRVGVNLIQSAIYSVSAIDRATIVLLESHDVLVFTHYGWTRVVFPMESFSRVMTGTIPNQHLNDNVTNHIVKLTGGGHTICALSSFGEVFTVDVNERPDARGVGTSTTHPSKAKNALTTPLRIWSIKKSHMSARDVAVGQQGSIVLCTEEGSVWRKEKRAKIKDASHNNNAKAKDYKFVRVPFLTRAIAVRSNAFGAFAAVRKDTDVTKEQIDVDAQTLWGEIFPLLPFREYHLPEEDSDEANPRPRFWTSYSSGNSPATIKQAILLSNDIETEIQDVLHRHEPLAESSYDVWLASNVSDVRIPAHSFMLAARSPILRKAFGEFQQSYYFAIPDVMSIEYGKDGQMQLLFQGADFITLLNLVFYIYCENVVDVWHNIRRFPASAARFRQVRRELMDISQKLEMKGLERAARLQVDPNKRLHLDMELAFADEEFFVDADIVVDLAGDTEIKAHSAIVCLRCPFFEGMFHGRAGGKWVASRRNTANQTAEAMRVNLQHVEPEIFTMVLRYIYADTTEELFDEVVTKDLDEFIDIVLEIMSVANELMLDRLAQVSQRILGRYVNIRNVCHLLNAVAPCTVDEFKKVALEYICLNLEVMLESHLLEELDEDLLVELDDVVRSNQKASSLIARTGKAEEDLLEAHPELIEQIELARQRKIDSMRLRTHLHEDEERAKIRIGSVDKSPALPQRRTSTTKLDSISPGPSPSIRPKASSSDLLFEMDDETGTQIRPNTGLGVGLKSPTIKPQDLNDDEEDDDDLVMTPKENEWTTVKGRSIPRSATASLPSIDKQSASKSQMKTPEQSASRPLTTTTGFVTTNTPWAASRNAEKTDLRDIMAQASSSRVSNLSLGLDSTESQSFKSSFGNKMSQKERKKMLQQQSQEKIESSSSSPWIPASDKKSQQLNSPWQSIRTPPAESIAKGTIASSAEAAKSSRPMQKPNMTMRQTVAGTPPTKPQSPAPTPSRSTSSPSTTILPTSSSSSRPQPTTIQPSSSSSPSVPQNSTPLIQSIRHTPVPPTSQPSMSATSKTSLLDILNQQQSEKAAIVEAKRENAKANMRDIQMEQEFQEWWDEESRKVREEEEEHQRRRAGDQRSRGRGGGKGGQRGGGGGGGGRGAAAAANSGRRGGGGGGGRKHSEGGGNANPPPSGSASTPDSSERPRHHGSRQHPPTTPSRTTGGGGGGRGGGGGGRRGSGRLPSSGHT